MYFFLTSSGKRQTPSRKLATAMKSLTGPLRAQAKLGRLELHHKAN